MTIKLLTLCFLIPGLAAAQIDCTGNQQLQGLRRGDVFTAPCDSMVVMNAPTYRRMALEKLQLEKQVALMGEANMVLEDMQQTQDSLLVVYQSEIRSFGSYYQSTDRSVAALQENLEQSIRNTEEAVKIARKNKLLGIILGNTAGLAGGILIGGIAF
jgi:hypothetical protein